MLKFALHFQSSLLFATQLVTTAFPLSFRELLQPANCPSGTSATLRYARSFCRGLLVHSAAEQRDASTMLPQKVLVSLSLQRAPRGRAGSGRGGAGATGSASTPAQRQVKAESGHLPLKQPPARGRKHRIHRLETVEGPPISRQTLENILSPAGGCRSCSHI